MLCLSWVQVHLITEAHSPAEKLGELFCKNWFPECLEIAQFPSPAPPLLQLLSPSLNTGKCLSPLAKQARDWAGHCVLLSLSINKIYNDGLLYEVDTEFRQLVSPQKSCLARAETNQNRELKIRVVLLIICRWQKMKELNLSPRYWESHITT